MRILLAVPGLLVVAAGLSQAQPERYELGQRLKAFEKAWDAQTDPAARKRALAILTKVTNQFFSFQLGEAGRTLDEARWLLTNDKPMPDDVRWAISLYPSVKSRFAPDHLDLTFEIKPFYAVKADFPRDLEAKVKAGNPRGWPFDAQGKPKQVGDTAHRVLTKPVSRITFDGERRSNLDRVLPIPKEIETPRKPIVPQWIDQVATVEFITAEKVRKTSTLSLFRPWKLRDDTLPTITVLSDKTMADSVEGATLAEWADVWKRVTGNEILETDFPLSTLVNASAEIAVLEGQSFFTPARPGDFWMAFPTGREARTPARLFVPEKLDPKTPVPLVVALHGAGGSEHLFFEGYGDGQIVKLCQKRGWLLVAPRSAMALLGGTPPVAEIVEQLSKRYPVDPKRVYLVGHSMGAAQAVDLAQKSRKLFAGVALLGGGGRVKDAAPFADLPTFIGVGTKDQLAYGMAKALNTTLTDAKAGKLTYKEYEDLEHLMIVREALPDAFKMFDAAK